LRNKFGFVFVVTALAFLTAASLAACGGTSSGPAMEHTIGLVYFAPEEGADCA
jgi:hypothetical protein